MFTRSRSAFSVFVYLLLFSLSSAFVSKITLEEPYESRKTRIYRQTGYAYNKPSISFDLPSRPTTVSTQAPNVDRVREQQMYYAYPAPASEGAVNIGFSTPGYSGGNTGAALSTVSSGPNGAAPEYNYGTQNTVSTEGLGTTTGIGRNGYNYDARSTPNLAIQLGSQTAPNSGSTGYTSSIGIQSGGLNIGASSGGTGFAASIGLQTESGSGYTASGGIGFNNPTGTSVNLIGSTGGVTGSTKAPEYLPPVGDSGGGNKAIGVTTPGPSNTISTGATPSDAYLPPSLSVSKVPSSILDINTPGVSVSTPTTGYLPPNPSPTASSMSPNSQTSVSPTGYLPPVISTSKAPTQGTVSTPASTYLPPVFKR